MAVKPDPEQPNVPTFAEDITPTATTDVPTPADYARHWGTYKAVTNLIWQGSIVVAEGAGVPLDHPGMSGEDGWVEQGLVELTGNYPAPDSHR